MAFSKRYVVRVRKCSMLTSSQTSVQKVVGRHEFVCFRRTRPRQDRMNLLLSSSFSVERDGDLIVFRMGAVHYILANGPPAGRSW